jgi:cytoskeletal protein RodZ
MAMASFGEKLRHERELRGVSLRDIADGTKISVRFLQALEDGRTDVLPGGLFPRAFVKQYALFLGLDAERTVAEFVEQHGEPTPERMVPPAPSGPRLSVTPGQILLGVLAVVVVVVLVRRPAESDYRHAKATPTPTPTPVAAAPAVLPTDRVYPPLANAAAIPADGLVLTMTAQEECWVEVRADGQTLVNRVLAEGESQTFEARGEIVLSVGNAGGLQLRVNDQPALPLGRSGEVRKNIVITRQSLPSLVEQGRTAAPDGQSG